MKLKSIFSLIVLLILVTITDCNIQDKKYKKSEDLIRLTSWMTGYFRSTAQSQKDTSYLDISLRMIPIWKERNDGYWIYVEQAVADYMDRPYRQRVYQIIQLSHNIFESRVYSLKDPMKYAGEWKKEKPLSMLNPNSIILRDGCSIILRKKDDEAFIGNTIGKECRSNLHGAHYATSEVELTENRLKSWDRGFNKEGVHLWGAEKGGYIFDKIKDYNLE